RLHPAARSRAAQPAAVRRAQGDASSAGADPDRGAAGACRGSAAPRRAAPRRRVPAHVAVRAARMRRRRLMCGLGLTLRRGRRAAAQSGIWPEWLGPYSGTIRFYRTIPLEDISPPPEHPHVDLDDTRPFAVYFSIHTEDAGAAIWLRIDGGPMQTAYAGETLHFGPPIDGFAGLIGADGKPTPRSASLLLHPDSLGTEALFSHADGSFWRRHFTARFTPAGADMIVWVFDAAGTRARTWRGSATRRE